MMKRLIKSFTKKLAVVLLLNQLVVLAALAQQADVTSKFSRYQESALQEKVFVHTDKATYLSGEIIWLKIYAADDTSNKPSDFSKVVYVDVIDNTQTAVVQAKVAIKEGSGSGSMYIPVTAGTGNYQLRAYTSWMKNFNPDYYFSKTITIINPLKSPTSTITANINADLDVQFFPEGGNMVSGIAGRVAFKITGSDGKGVNLDGAIVNQKNDTIVKFRPARLGMGTFVFTPVATDRYKAVVKVGGKWLIKPLPAVQGQGYAMRVNQIYANRAEVTVKSTVAASGPLFLFVHTRQVTKIAEGLNLTDGTATFTIDKTKLGDGISHITLFNNAGQPVCERLIFKQPSQKLLLTAAADLNEYNPRKKVSVDISAQTQDHQPVASDLSIAVYRIDSLQKNDESSILSYLWLSSDLAGKIESPDYYFKKADAQTAAALDVLLMTQGWRRFDWESVLKGQPAPLKFLPETDGHIITGKIAHTQTGQPVANMLVHMGVPGKRIQYYNAKSDSTGRLLFNTNDFYGNNEVILQTDQAADSTYTLSISNPFSESYSAVKLPALKLSPDMIKSLSALSIGMQAQNIYNGKKLNQFYEPQVDSAAFYYQPDKIYPLENFTRFTTIEEIFREFIVDVNVAKIKGKFHLKVFNGDVYMESDPLVLLDGVPILDVDKAFAIDPLKVKSIEVLPKRYYYGSLMTCGIVSLSTYKNDLGGFEINPHAAIVDYEGMQARRVFYSPVYDTQQQAESTIPDFRNVLYWQPKAGTDATGKRSLSFFTSDLSGKYIGVVQGTTASGQAGSGTFTFEVKNGAL